MWHSNETLRRSWASVGMQLCTVVTLNGQLQAAGPVTVTLLVGMWRPLPASESSASLTRRLHCTTEPYDPVHRVQFQ